MGFCVGDDLDSKALAQLTKLKQLQQLEFTRLHWHDNLGGDWSRPDEDEELVMAEEQLGRQFHGRLNTGQEVSPVRGEPQVASAYTGSAGCWVTLSGQLLTSSDRRAAQTELLLVSCTCTFTAGSRPLVKAPCKVPCFPHNVCYLVCPCRAGRPCVAADQQPHLHDWHGSGSSSSADLDAAQVTGAKVAAE